MVSACGAVSPRVFSRLPMAAVMTTAALLLTSCSQPPDPATEPEPSAGDQMLSVATAQNPVDETIAHIYAIMLNSHDTGAQVVIHEESSQASLAAALARNNPDQVNYDLVIARTATLLSELQQASSTNERPQAPNSAGTATENPASEDDGAERLDPEEVLAEASEYYEQDQLGDPAQAQLGAVFAMSAAKAAQLTGAVGQTPGLADIEDICDEAHIGVWSALEEPAQSLEADYDCAPQELSRLNQDELIAGLIYDEIDLAVLPTGHPGIAQNALVTVPDSENSFLEERYVPVFSEDSAGELPEALAEIPQALNNEGYQLLRELLYGPDPLAPQEAALFWLVDRGLVAAPEDWAR